MLSYLIFHIVKQKIFINLMLCFSNLYNIILGERMKEVMCNSFIYIILFQISLIVLYLEKQIAIKVQI